MSDDDDIPEPDWSALPGEILGVIAHRFLIKLKDFIRFQAVCKTWRRALAAEDKLNHPRRRPRFTQSVPWLMLPYCRSSNMIRSSEAMAGCKGTDSCRCFFDVTEQRFHHIEVEMPEGFINSRRTPTCCRGSSFGWLFMLQRGPSLLLLNPLTGDRIWLPPITSFPHVEGFRPEKVGCEYRFVMRGEKIACGKMAMERRYIMKVALSSEPTSEDCVVMVIHSPEYPTLAFCRPMMRRGGDDEVWTEIPRDGDGFGYFTDVVFWRGQFYVMDEVGRISVCSITAAPPKLSKFVVHPCPEISCKSYLVKSPDGGALMMVARNVIELEDDDDDDDGGLDEFLRNRALNHGHVSKAVSLDGADAYIMDRDDDDDGDGGDTAAAVRADVNPAECQSLTGEFKVYKLNEDTMAWVEVESIDDFAIFLGINSAACVSTTDHPELGLIPNSVYYTDDMYDDHVRHKYAGSDMGVYNLATRTVQPLYSISSVHARPSLISTIPVWILPSI
ncbi:unnamed protein product [Linum trigynum]|uniref:KIB1-4 beta-propeller domain-containing protein n=1 Tax=Linum trigynum TaxID=586398 RepID=A0AAV2G1G7_9ROSI